jgi:VWFA-related protein
LGLVLVAVQARPQAGSTQNTPARGNVSRQIDLAQQSIPDAPRPQPTLPNLNTVTPGEGTTSSSNVDTPVQSPSAPTTATPPSGSQTSGAQAAGETQTYEVPVGQGENAIKTLYVHVDAVDKAFTVKDKKGHLVSGITGREVQVYENGVMQHIEAFTVDSQPMSVALVIDQSMTQDEMTLVNNALGALQDAFAASDEVAIFTYNKSPKEVTEFTGAQSARLKVAIERSKGSGRDAVVDMGGPLSQTTVINNQNFDPNTAAVRNHTGIQLTVPREVHTLNDAILAAASSLSNRPRERRRVVYVISDGKEYGSKAKQGDVVKYLQRNNIEVDGTLVGDSAVWGLGTLDRIHLPLMMRDNVLPAYANLTGGNIDADFRTGEIEKSFAKILVEARTRYTVGWRTHESFLDGKYRKLEIKVLRPDLTILAPQGYWPGALEMRPANAPSVSMAP